ncbi:uncharacterized protein [Arachis hypogaea]|uniref:uncharacterized protein n=1 Tax=Arachis hypogaea TaxID=3818 RepID=UPI000DEC74BC|nr:uncharacterized protein LOC112707556 [Arachis hypogaea]
MVDVFGVPVFHHGGNFSRRASGELVYVNGQVEKFPPMDLDFVNFGDLVTMFKGLGYQSYKEAYWYDPKGKDMEPGLHVLKGDAGINQMRQAKLRNKDTEEFYIFFTILLTILRSQMMILRKMLRLRKKSIQMTWRSRMARLPPMIALTVMKMSRINHLQLVMKVGVILVKMMRAEGLELPKKRGNMCLHRRGKGLIPMRSQKNKQHEFKRQRFKARRVGSAGESSSRSTRPAKQPNTSRPGSQPNRSRPAREPSMRPAIADYVSDVDTDNEDIVFEYESEELHTPVSSEDEGNKPH